MGSKRSCNFVVPGSRCTAAFLHVLKPGAVLERCGDKGRAHRMRQVVVRGCVALRSRSRCFGIGDRVARAPSDDCSPWAGVAGRDCCFSHPKIDKLASYTLVDRGIRKWPQKRKERMADIPVQRYSVRLQIINSETSSPAPSLQMQEVVAKGYNE
jgi:hypothetical protein